MTVAHLGRGGDHLDRPAQGQHGDRPGIRVLRQGRIGNLGPVLGMMGNNSMRTAHHAVIPETYASLSNPMPADAVSVERGAAIFASSCAVCHGDGGMGDGPGAVNLEPEVSAIAHTSQMLSDAYLFWRISEGGQGDPLQ